MKQIFEMIRTKNVNDLKCYDGEILNFDDLIVEIGKRTQNVIDIIGGKINEIEFHLLNVCDYSIFSDDIYILIVNYNDCEQFTFISIFDGEIQPEQTLYFTLGCLFYDNIEKIVSRETL